MTDINSGPGWYEVISPRATTCIVYVYENGTLYLPEGEESLSPTEFAFAAATGNAHRLVRADEAQQDPAQDGEAAPLRGELKPWQLLADQPDEPLPQTERVVGGRRLPRPGQPDTDEETP